MGKPLRVVPLFSLVALLVHQMNAYGQDPARALVPKTTVSATVEIIEKGHPFQIILTVIGVDSLRAFSVTPLMPLGFCARPDSIAGALGVRIASDGTVYVKGLDQLGSFRMLFTVEPPRDFRLARDLLDFGLRRSNGCTHGRMAERQNQERNYLDTTRYSKVFSFNVLYQLTSGPPVGDVVELKVPYTTSQAVFVTGGMIGVVLGFLVKRRIQRSGTTPVQTGESPVTNAQLAPNAKQGWWTRLRQLFLNAKRGWWTRLRQLFLNSDFLSTLIIGLGILLTLAQVNVPVSSFIASIALGVGIGVVSDETLISKLPRPGI